MEKVNVQVNGVIRKIYIEKFLSSTEKCQTYRARTYVGSNVVSGTLKEYAKSRKFIASGVNAWLVE